ncbi:MAG: hypothetical protein PHG05_01395 [Candidatus Nanoarchaeia archaeon]|nr:hypothetical protein [Candidatus Nanoarchaeia archaeon]
MIFNKKGEDTSQSTIIKWIIGLIVLIVVIIGFLFLYSSSKRKTGSIQEQIEGVDLNLGDFFESIDDSLKGKDYESAVDQLSCDKDSSEESNGKTLELLLKGYAEVKDRKLPELEDKYKEEIKDCYIALNEFKKAKEYGFELDKVCNGQGMSLLNDLLSQLAESKKVLTKSQCENNLATLNSLCGDLNNKNLNTDVKNEIENAKKKLGNCVDVADIKTSKETEAFAASFREMIQKVIKKDYAGALKDIESLSTSLKDEKVQYNKAASKNQLTKKNIEIILEVIKSRLIILSQEDCNNIKVSSAYQTSIGSLFDEKTFDQYFMEGSLDYKKFEGVMNSVLNVKLDPDLSSYYQLKFDKALCQYNKGALDSAYKTYEELLKDTNFPEKNTYRYIMLHFEDECKKAYGGDPQATRDDCEAYRLIDSPGLFRCVFIDDYDDTNYFGIGAILTNNKGACHSCATVKREDRNCKAYTPSNKVWGGLSLIQDPNLLSGDGKDGNFPAFWDNTCNDDPCNFGNCKYKAGDSAITDSCS